MACLFVKKFILGFIIMNMRRKLVEDHLTFSSLVPTFDEINTASIRF